MEDKLWEENTIGKLSADMPLELQTFELPPLSVFLDAVTENATVKRAQSEVEQVKMNIVYKNVIGGIILN